MGTGAAPDDAMRRLVHDLRNPLAVVGGFADILARQDDELSPEERAGYVERIRVAAEQMRDVLDRVTTERLRPPG